MEYDDARSGSFAPLPTIWNNRDHVELVLGVITSKDPALEDVDAVIARIHEAAELVHLRILESQLNVVLPQLKKVIS